MYCEMNVLKEQRVCIKFCQKLGKTATETYEMLQQAFGETAFSRSKTFEWYSRFKNGCTSIDNDPHTGQPSMARINETVDHVNVVICGCRHLMIREIADELNLSFGLTIAILQFFALKHQLSTQRYEPSTTAHMVRKLLTAVVAFGTTILNHPSIITLFGCFLCLDFRIKDLLLYLF
jgi:hypothetical protein